MTRSWSTNSHKSSTTTVARVSRSGALSSEFQYIVQFGQYIGISLLVSLSACTSFRSVPASQLEERQLAGHWKSGSSRLEIYCSGALNYDLESLTGLPDTTGGKCDGCNVSEIHSNELIAGPGFRHKTFEVVKWPFQSQGTWRMNLAGREWVREKVLSCSQ